MSFSRRCQRALILVAPLLLLAGCNVAYSVLDRVTGRAPARFALFGRNDMRAGVRFAVLEHAATFESRVPYRCVELWPGARQCTVPIQPGKLIAIVDDRNRVARLTVVTADPLLYGTASQASADMENAANDTRDKWNAMHLSKALPAGDRGVELRWQDGSGRSGASIWYAPAGTYGRSKPTGDSLSAVPDSMAVTDLRAYGELLANSPFKNQKRARSEVAVATPTRAADSSTRVGVQKPIPPAPPRVAPEDVLSAMHSDLRALSIAQEKYLREKGEYARKLEVLHVLLSTGVSVELVPSKGDGWVAIASHAGVPGLSCVIYSGAVENVPRTRRAGVRAPSPGTISCDPS